MKEEGFAALLRERVRPSHPNGSPVYPCAATLGGGEVLSRLVVAIDTGWKRSGLPPEPAPTVIFDDISDVFESPFRLSPDLLRDAYHRGETGMGALMVVLTMSDGERLLFKSGWILDFPDLPAPYSPADVVAAGPAGGAAWKLPVVSPAVVDLCYL